MTCCTSIEDLGCIYSCDTIQIGISTPTTGTYTIELQPDGIKVVSTENTAGQPLAFPGSYLNEDATSVFKIIKPDGSYLETDDGEDCFQVEIRPSTTPPLDTPDTLCGFIQEATAEQIADCLSDVQELALQDIICDEGGEDEYLAFTTATVL